MAQSSTISTSTRLRRASRLRRLPSARAFCHRKWPTRCTRQVYLFRLCRLFRSCWFSQVPTLYGHHRVLPRFQAYTHTAPLIPDRIRGLLSAGRFDNHPKRGMAGHSDRIQPGSKGLCQWEANSLAEEGTLRNRRPSAPPRLALCAIGLQIVLIQDDAQAGHVGHLHFAIFHDGNISGRFRRHVV